MSLQKVTSITYVQSENTQIVSLSRPALFLHLNDVFEPYTIDTQYCEKRMLIRWNTEVEETAGEAATQLYAYSEASGKYHLVEQWWDIDILGALEYIEANLV
jgi:hypothetical protein